MAQLLSREQIDAWDRDGFLICRSVLSPQQAEVARQITLVDPTLAAAATGNANYDGSEQHDGAAAAAESGLPPPLKTVLSHAEFSPSDDVCSAWAASARVLRPLEQLFRSPVAHYYSILMRKEPNTGGWLYHQDYGYHYAQFLRPDGYASAMLALAPATKDNGCLRVYRGSHRLGRLEHASVGAQQIADPERVARAAQVREICQDFSPPGVDLRWRVAPRPTPLGGPIARGPAGKRRRSWCCRRPRRPASSASSRTRTSARSTASA